jgi:hypothetical protein
LAVALTPAIDQSWSFIIKYADWSRYDASGVFGAGASHTSDGFGTWCWSDKYQAFLNGDYGYDWGFPTYGEVGVLGTKAYRDGELVATLPGWSQPAPSTLYIGAYNSSRTNIKIWGVAVYSQVVSLADYNAVRAEMALW